MRVLIGGATGAIGRPLIRFLRERGHAVFALARSPGSARVVAALGAETVTADVLDATAMKAAIMRVRPEAVINELTSLPRHYTVAEMAAAAERDRQVRIEGNKNFLAVLPETGVRRYLLQSSGFWYAPGVGLADENEPFAFAASPAVAAGTRRYAELEQTASASTGIEFVALRYGFFYGPGTWFDSAGDMGEQVRRQEVPVIGDGQGVCGAGCISRMRRPRPPRHWNARRVPTTLLTTTPPRNSAGYRCSLTRLAHHRHRVSQKRRR